MAERILMTPQELRDAADFVIAQQGCIKDAVDVLKSKLDDVCSRWEGASQQAFISQFEEIYSKMLSTQVPEILDGVSQELRLAADTIEQADDSIASAMKNG